MKSMARSTTLMMIFGVLFVMGHLDSTKARAVTLNVDAMGQLLGASDVDVGGTLYDVTFLDGTCVALFSGCDDPTEFTFQSQPAATQAGQALLDQVLLDGPLGAFDTDPTLTFGCSDGLNCDTVIPHSLSSGGFIASFVRNTTEFTILEPDRVFGVTVIPSTFETTAIRQANFATFIQSSSDPSPIPGPDVPPSGPAPIPEPGTILLLGSGLLGLAGYRWRQRRREREQLG